MRRLVTLFVLAISLFCRVQQTFANEINTASPDIQKIIDRGTLIVALYNKDVPPFFMQDADGNLTGYDISLAKNLAKAMGVKVEFHRTMDTFDGVVDEVAKGNADIAISLLSITLPRALKVDFSTPYAYLPQAFLYNRLAAAQKHYSDFTKDLEKDSSITLGVLNKSSYVKYAEENYPHAKIILYDDIDFAMQDVLHNKLFAFYLNEVEIKNWLAKHPGENLYLNYQRIVNKLDPIGIAASWHDTRLIDWINWFLFINNKNGTIAKLQQQYFHGPL